MIVIKYNKNLKIDKMIIENLNVKNLVQHPVHKDMFGDPTETEKNLSSLDEAFDRTKKLLPVLYVLVLEGDIEIFYVIDGWSSVVTYREKGIETIPCMKVDLDNPDELPYLLADLHTNYHNDPEEDYKKFSYFYNILSLGKGFRSDLINENEE